jgi:chromosome segregation ATPase
MESPLYSGQGYTPTDKAMAVNLKMATGREVTAADFKLKRLNAIRKELAEESKSVIEQQAAVHKVQEEFRARLVAMEAELKKTKQELAVTTRELKSLKRENKNAKRNSDYWQHMYKHADASNARKDAKIARLEALLHQYDDEDFPHE